MCYKPFHFSVELVLLVEEIQFNSFELQSEKTGLQGFRPGLIKLACTVTEDG